MMGELPSDLNKQDNARRYESLGPRLTLIQLFSVVSLKGMYLEAIAFQLRAKKQGVLTDKYTVE